MGNKVNNLGDGVINYLLDGMQSQGQDDEKLECVELVSGDGRVDGLILLATLASTAEDLAAVEVVTLESTEDGAVTNAQAALNWLEFGFAVIPTEPGTDLAAVDSDTWCADLSPDAVTAHWATHPTHDVGAVVGDSLVVARFEGAEAQAALFQTERAFDVWPSMMFKTPLGMDHFFSFPSDTKVRPGADSQGEHSGEITLLTGSAIVLLPPSGGRKLDLDQASDASDMTAVDQAFIDAIQASYGKPNSAVATSSAPEATFASTGESKAGEGGEAGVLGGTAFTAFGRPSAGQIDTPVIAMPQAAAVPTSSTNGAAQGGEAGGGMNAPDSQTAAAAFADQQEAVLAPATQFGVEPPMRQPGDSQDDVLTPKASQNPVVAALMSRGLYKTPLGSGLHLITCPWANEHAHGEDCATTYMEPSDLHVTGAYSCQHAHAERHHTRDLLELLGVPKADARHKAVIRIVTGDLHRVLDAAERELANRGQHFQAGGLIVSVQTDPVTGDPKVAMTNTATLTRELSQVALWEKFDGRTQDYLPTDPPPRQVSLLHGAQSYSHLPALAGLARQPYLRQSDGMLITQAGYNPGSQLFGVFDSQKYPMRTPTREAALAALAMLEELVEEFHFAEPTDKAAAICGMLTAAQRISLPYAPGFHVEAPVFGSGKTLLCETIGAFAGPGANLKVSYPTTSEEATKVILSLLMTSPAVIEFDDMATDWIPHGTINRMLTAEKITDRILGVSKTATVSTRTLFLGSGNNVGPVRDVRRRVLTVHIDPRSASPATLRYRGNPLQRVRQDREKYVCAALTIALAWMHAGSPSADIASIATYGGAWTERCRMPLVWLGYPDPATSLLEQLQNDPDTDALGALLVEWHKAFGSNPTTVRKVISVIGYGNEDLTDAIGGFPVAERGVINPSKLGWILKRNLNRIVGGYKFVEAKADGRNAWAVVPVTPPASPSLSASIGQGSKTVAPTLTTGFAGADTSDLY